MTRDEVAGIVIAKVLAREGGVVQLTGEGFVTRFGQTPQWLADFGLPMPTTPEQAAANYRTWLVRTRLIGLCDIADSFADAAIDWSVNAGQRVAIRGLQAALGIPADGIYGPETQAAVNVCNRRGMACRIVAARERFNGRLIAGDPGRYGRFAAGWSNRIADQIEALAS